MASSPINIISTPGSPSVSDSLRSALAKINTNLSSIDTQLSGKVSSSTLTSTFNQAPFITVPAYTGGVQRTYLDRFGDYVNAHDFSDGSGSAANDDKALTAALAQAKTSRKAVLITRPFRVTTEKTIVSDMRIIGVGSNNALIATAPMRSILNADYQTNGTGADRISLENLDLSNSNNNFSYATALVRVNKGHNNYPFRMNKVSGASATKFLDWISGDMPILDDIWLVNTVDGLYFRNNGMNGYIANIHTLGGRALYVNRNPSDAVPNQMEGTKFVSCQFLTTGPVNGVTTTAGVEIRAGLAISFHGLLIDQLSTGMGLLIDGSDAGRAIYDVNIHSLWIGAADPSSGTNGMWVKGNANEINVFGGEVVGMTGDGIHYQGTSTIGVSGSVYNVVCRQNGGVDLFSSYNRGSYVNCSFLSTKSGTSVFESTNSSINGDGNTFSVGPILSNGSNWLRNRGPGAARGIPTIGTQFPGPGWFWLDGANLRVN